MTAKEISKTANLAIDAASDELNLYIEKLLINIPSSVFQSDYETLYLLQLNIIEEVRVQIEAKIIHEATEANKELLFLNPSCNVEKNIL